MSRFRAMYPTLTGEGKLDRSWLENRRIEDEHDEEVMDFERYGEHAAQRLLFRALGAIREMHAPLPPWDGVRNSELARFPLCQQPKRQERPYVQKETEEG